MQQPKHPKVLKEKKYIFQGNKEKKSLFPRHSSRYALIEKKSFLSYFFCKFYEM